MATLHAAQLAFDQVLDRVQAGITRAQRLDRPVLVSSTARIDATDPLDLFVAAHTLGEQAFFWSDTAQQFAMLGVGVAQAIEHDGPERFTQTGAAWRAVLDHAVIERDGVIGASMDCFMIHPGINVNWGQDVWPDPRDVFAREEVTLEMLANHVDYVCQMAGDALHAGIGGDTDGQGGIENAPLEIDTVNDYNRLADIFRSRGYSEADVENLMYRNWVRLFERALPSA